MSVMVLRTQGPAALFDDHKLVLHTTSYDAERAQVFHVCGEFVPLPLAVCALLPGCLPGNLVFLPWAMLTLWEMPWWVASHSKNSQKWGLWN